MVPEEVRALEEVPRETAEPLRVVDVPVERTAEEPLRETPPAEERETLVRPVEETIEEKNGKKKVVLRRRCPCYVFLKMIYRNELWFLITNTRGVTGFVGPMGHPAPLSDAEVQRMHLDETVKDGFELSVGENVKIVSGALDGFIGEVVAVNETAQKATVKVPVFGRETSVEVDFVDLLKIEELPA